MADSCTLMCAKSDSALALATLSKHLKDGHDEMTVEGETQHWTKITILGSRATIVVNSLKYRQAGDEFSRLIMGMHNYLRNIDTSAVEVKQDVLERVGRCRYALGVVAEPEFLDEAGHFEFVFGLAEALDALIWNGSGLVDTRGRIVLDVDGISEII